VKKAEKLRKKAAGQLKGALKAIGKTQKKKQGGISGDCPAALRAAVTAAQSQVEGFRF